MFDDDWVTTRRAVRDRAPPSRSLAWGFAYLYVAVQIVWPKLVHRLRSTLTRPRTWFELLYLSITTLTSTGLSDVIRRGGRTRGPFVMIEQIAGIMYVALIVARLVGLTIARSSAAGPDGGTVQLLDRGQARAGA